MERIERLRKRLTTPLPSEMCFERARLMTESYRDTEGEPAPIRRAKAFYRVLDGIPITIDADELIVGNVASKPRVAYFAPETFSWGRYESGKEQVSMDSRFSRSLAITAADSLVAIRKAVFEDEVITIERLKEALLANFEGFEVLRQYLLKRIPKFGNDDDTADELARRVVEVNHGVIEELGESDYRGGLFATGSGGATTYLCGKQTGATPDGRLAGTSLSVNLGPSAGVDTRGPTATLKSVSKLTWDQQVGGGAYQYAAASGSVVGNCRNAEAVPSGQDVLQTGRLGAALHRR